jgi:hypothetical protein
MRGGSLPLTPRPPPPPLACACEGRRRRSLPHRSLPRPHPGRGACRPCSCIVLQVDAQGLATAALLAVRALSAVDAHAHPAALGAVAPDPAVRADRAAPAVLHLAPAALPAVGADRGAPAALHLAHASHTAVGADRGAPAALHLALVALPAVGADRGAPAALHLAHIALPTVDADTRPAAFLAVVLSPPVRAFLLLLWHPTSRLPAQRAVRSFSLVRGRSGRFARHKRAGRFGAPRAMRRPT